MSTTWLTELIDAINVHTEPGEGITRPSYSVLETKAMRTVGSRAIEHGLQVEWDYVGNLHIVKHGTFPEVVTGSHLDSVPNGGRYDGVAGVVAGLFAIINSNTPRQLRLIVFRGEESAWFGKCYLGSEALFATPDVFLRHKDGETLGIKLCDLRAHALAEPRGAPEHLFTPENTLRFLEVHIEQGPVLHAAGHAVGIVTAIRGNHRYPDCAIHGEAGHSGTTPMELRRDAVLGFADLMKLLEAELDRFRQHLVLTCGIVSTDSRRHAMSVIPDLVKFALEYRSSRLSDLERFEDLLRLAVGSVTVRRNLTIDLGERLVTEPVSLDPELRAQLQMIASRHAATPQLPSGAGHDAAVFQKHGIPTGMIFVRNEHGSHNPRESMDVKDLLIATEVLRDAMCE